MNLPLNEIPLTSLEVYNADVASMQSGTVTNGYGRVSGATVTATIGATASIKVNANAKVVTEKDFKEWAESAKQSLSTSDIETLDKQYGSSGQAAGWLTWWLGLAAGYSSDHYSNQSNSHWSTQDSSQAIRHSITKFHELNEQEVSITGNLEVTGMSYYPSVATAYIKITTIKFQDGTKKSVISTSNAKGASPEGSTKGIKTTGSNINVTPL